MQRDSDRQGEEDAWRTIVENYGDRPTLDDEDDAPTEEPPAATATEIEPLAPPAPAPEVAALEWVPDAEHFVPPPVPASPALTRDRLAAWVGLFGAPAVLLVCVVAGVALPGLLAYLLVGAFVGGFLYLVVTMPNGPADPFDDGARL